MVIGTFRRHVAKSLTPKATKTALRTVSKSTSRMLIAQGAVALKGHTGQLLQVTSQYLLGAQQTPEMKAEAARVLGDIGYDLTVLARVLKVKLPSSTKKSKLVGTRGAAILQLDSSATDLLRQAEQGMFVQPQMTTVKKMVNMPQKGGAKEERDVDVVDLAASQAAEMERQTEMKSYLSGAIDVFWRLCFDLMGAPPDALLDAKFARMQQEFPAITFDTEAKPVAAKTKKAPKAKKAEEPVPA